MDNEDGGDAEIKFTFLRFVPEEGHPDEGRFRYAPLPSAGLPFINPENKEGQDINANEIYDDCSQVRRVVTPINPIYRLKIRIARYNTERRFTGDL